MGLISRVGRLGVFLFFVGLAITQMQYPQQAIKQTHEKTNQFYNQLAQLTKSPKLELSLEYTPLVVFACAVLKCFVGIGVLLKWNYVKIIGSLYLLSAIFIVYNPSTHKQYDDSLAFLGALGALQFV